MTHAFKQCDLNKRGKNETLLTFYLHCVSKKKKKKESGPVKGSYLTRESQTNTIDLLTHDNLQFKML